MESKLRSQNTENDLVQIKAINEDDYWTKEFDIPIDELKKHDASIYDLIADAHIRTQKSDN